MLLDDTVLPDTIRLPGVARAPFIQSSQETQEACRALKGSILRQEIYALDGTDASDRPYRASQRNYTIECLQPQGPNQHAVFFSHARETIDFHYERKLYDIGGEKRADPRVSHALTLAVDDYGNVLQSVAIGYGRRHDDPGPLLTEDDKKKQTQTLITYTENAYTNAIDDADDYRTPLPCETRTYELIKVKPEANKPLVTNRFRFEEMQSKVQAASDGAHDIPYEDFEAAGASEDHPYRRLIEQARTLYRKNDLTGLLSPGELQSMALPGESYKLAFTPGLLAKVYRRPLDAIQPPGSPPPEDLLPNPGGVLGRQGADQGGYLDLDANGHWWIPSGQVFYSRDIGNTPAELAFARQHFFQPHRFQDPFGNNTFVSYDTHDLLLLETEDTLGNKVTAGERSTTAGPDPQPRTISKLNYRVLQPELVTDPNGNRSEVRFDVLGMVVGTAVMGKSTEPLLGDSLEGFQADLTLDEVRQFIANPKDKASALLKGASTRVVYDLDRFKRCGQAPFAATLAREIHVHDPGGDRSPIQVSFTYSDGFGREVETKIQAEPGDAPQRGTPILLACGDIAPVPLVLDVNRKPVPGPANPRWVGKGRTVYNNKGKPVKQYEPFFSSTHLHETEPEMTDTGVTPILFYDPVDRVVATVHPNHTWDKVVFDPWRQETWDVNDTVLVSNPKDDPDVGDFFVRLPASDYLPTWYTQRIDDVSSPEQEAAVKTAVHANTPTVAHFDTLGRTFLTVAHNRFKYSNAPATDPPAEEFHATRVVIDIEGNQREVIDPLGRIVMRYDYDMLSKRIHQASMEAGERCTLNDVLGKPIRTWDSRGHDFRTGYDALRRPLQSFVTGAGPQNPGKEILFGKTYYGEGQPNDTALNLRTHVFRQNDGAAVVTNEEYDFKGNLLRSTHQLVQDYKAAPDWSVSPVLEPEVFVSSTTYDALNRPVTLTTPDASVIHTVYNEANLLEQLSVNLRRGERDAVRQQHRLQRQRAARTHRLWQRRRDEL